jgi:rhodanese-related sulfurtransferase
MFARLIGLRTISPAELHELIQRGAVTTIDVNGPLSWNTAHVPGALRLDPKTFTAHDLPTDVDSTLVFYCSNFLCRKAPLAAHRARRLGYRDVRVMSAGISGWLDASLPTESAASG